MYASKQLELLSANILTKGVPTDGAFEQKEKDPAICG